MTLTARLRALLDDAPARAGELVDALKAGEGAVTRMRQLAADVDAVVQLRQAVEAYAKLTDGVRTAAEALDEQAPKLPALPKVLPTRGDVDTVTA